MEQDLGSNHPSGSIDKCRVLELKPLRCLVPVFPTASGMSSAVSPHLTPFVCVSPTGPFPPGIQPFYPFVGSTASQGTPFSIPDQAGNFDSATHMKSPVAPIPLSSFQTPINPSRVGIEESNVEDGYADSWDQSEMENGKNSGKRKGRPRKKRDEKGDQVVETLANKLVASFKLNEFDDFRRSSGDKEIASKVLLVFDLLRRKLTQMEEALPGISKHPNLTAGTTLLAKGIRTNSNKRVGNVSGVEVGDIFFFRMELCMVGLHAPIMAGIDYLSIKQPMNEEPLAVSIVSSGGYDDEGGDGNVLVYTGQGGVQRKDGQLFDQKLERGNLALEKSLHRASDVRVIRGLKDFSGSNGKIYVYDGLYKIEESWVEKNKSGCNVFKYKLVRKPRQPEVFTLWKSIQQWKCKNAPRPGVIHPDISSGVENAPVPLINEVDDEKQPSYFTYTRKLNYSKPFSSANAKPVLGCHCLNGCQPGSSDCPCNLRNNGYIPYTALGILASYNMEIHECGHMCTCPPNCRNRMSQAGLKVHLEVFKTENRGWGIRSWDPIRAGGFICEYAGDVIDDASRIGEFENENGNYIFDSTRNYEGAMTNNSNGAVKVSFPIIVNAKNNGNVARFMNHSCSPNVYWQPVLRESNNDVYVHIAFFAVRHIPPMQELTYDYGVVLSEKGINGRKKCFCGSMKCRGYFY